MATEQLEKLVVQLSAKLMDTEEKLKNSVSSEALWYKEYTKLKKELEELKSKMKEEANG
jgi:hypothetical protein